MHKYLFANRENCKYFTEAYIFVLQSMQLLIAHREKKILFSYRDVTWRFT